MSDVEIPKLTPAQREALLAAYDRHPDPVYLSNRNGVTFIARPSYGVLRRLGLLDTMGTSLQNWDYNRAFITLKGREVAAVIRRTEARSGC